MFEFIFLRCCISYVDNVQGMGCDMEIAQRAQFAKEVYEWSGEKPMDPNNVLNYEMQISLI